MNRRTFLHTSLALSTLIGLPPVWNHAAASSQNARLLILIALAGGNDGLNTLIPFADPHYRTLRPDLAIATDQIVKLSEHEGLHPQLAPLRTIWEARELAIIRGLGYPDPNLSHFRSMDIWETASRSDEVLTTGWLDRALAAKPGNDRAGIDGIILGEEESGTLAGGQARVITLTDLGQFQRQAQRLGVPPSTQPMPPALRHVVEVENRIRHAANQMRHRPALQTPFPDHRFGRAMRSACEVIANRHSTGLRVVHLSLRGFDTHSRQAPTQARLFEQLATGLLSLRAGLQELQVWNDTLILTYSDFGRRPQQNANGGTDHGTASVQFALGGRVKGGLHGKPVSLAHLDSNGNPGFTVDFRCLYATVLEQWWGMDSRSVLGGRFGSLNLI
ncbi:DUF1501 domain-containing protein [Rhabdochromatium marinum]|uniref:DUF1501 domain-containing protein n=1 Tax=Rhabdochromatium marinum TaxID=48729 RepID=UPI001905744D|nr:DUF1501 domain-containing protein [Rhabdochromatium marinum]MBK1648032.1 hypothetical protein [Rhabdochromatium marinum]